MANETIRRRIRMGRRMLPLNIPEGDQPGEQASAVEQPGGERPVVSFLRRLYPLSGGPRTAAIAVACGAVSGTLLVPALVFVGLPGPLAVVAGLLLGTGMAVTVGTFREQRMRELFQDRFLVAIEDFERMARFGIGTSQAIASIAASAEEPVRPTMAKVALDADLGVPLAVAIGREARRIRISEMAMLAAIVSTQTRTGGGLTEAVANLAQMLRERIDNRARLKAATAESKISLIILSLVPVAAIGILATTQPEVFRTLLGSARYLLGIGVGLIALGIAVAFFMVRAASR
ncbi:MAG: type II secretion system F family protein [Gammaproteobacteria bacterium]|nr:type II secretion system F family protein [Gammaproteobacteria bacterium]